MPYSEEHIHVYIVCIYVRIVQMCVRTYAHTIRLNFCMYVYGHIGDVIITLLNYGRNVQTHVGTYMRTEMVSNITGSS